MGRPRKPPPTFPVTRERAYELTNRIPIGSRLTLEARPEDPSKLRWSARTPMRNGERGKHIPVGTDEHKRELEDAWVLVGAELEAARAIAEGAPELRRLRELESLAGGPSVARASADIVEVPILAASSFGGGSRGQRPK